jgi:hypothetical protein
MREGIREQEKIDKRLATLLQGGRHPFGDLELSLALRRDRRAIGAVMLKQIEKHALQSWTWPAPLSQLCDQLTRRSIGGWTSNWRADSPSRSAKLGGVGRLDGPLLGPLDNGIVQFAKRDERAAAWPFGRASRLPDLEPIRPGGYYKCHSG